MQKRYFNRPVDSDRPKNLLCFSLKYYVQRYSQSSVVNKREFHSSTHVHVKSLNFQLFTQLYNIL